MKKTDARKNNRVAVQIPAQIVIDPAQTTRLEGEITDISLEGAFIRCDKPLAIGQEIWIQIRFSETALLRAKVTEAGSLPTKDPIEPSIVRWSRTGETAGFGVQFVSLKEDSQSFVKKLLVYFSNLAKAGVSFG